MGENNSNQIAVRNPAGKMITVEITNIKCSNLPSVERYKGNGKYYVKLLVGKDTKAITMAADGHRAFRMETFRFDAHNFGTLELQVYAHRRIGRDSCVGSVKESIGDLLVEGATGDVTRELSNHSDKGNSNKKIAITFAITSHDTSTKTVEPHMDEAVVQARNTVKEMNVVPLLLNRAEGARDAVVEDYVTAWEPLLEKIQLFTTIVDRISEVHPYAKMAWTVLGAAQKVILAQNDRDKSINALVRKMNDVYSFVHEAEPLKKVESCKQTVTLLVQQTTECAYFIHDYAKNKNFWKRTLKNLVSDADSRIKRYQGKFDELQSAFRGRIALQTGITVLRTWDTIDDLATEIDLNDMPYAKGAWYNPEKGCLPGTREEMIDEICQWGQSTDDDVPRIFLLSGVAGSGKSAIAHTVAQRFEQLKRLGSSFCFDRALLAERHPGNLFSTIARDLADLDPQWKKSLWHEIQEKRAIRNTRVASLQFENFILKPAADLNSVGPIVIVIDALDESGDQSTRRDLLSILAKKTSSLPANFRILVTARAERDIQEAFDGSKDVICRHMANIDAKSTVDDISLFVQGQLADAPVLERQWPGSAWRQLLVDKSEGLFQWAFTACRFVKGDGEEGLDPCEQLEILLSPTSQSASRLSQLDKLYFEILSRAFQGDNATRMDRFKTVMGRIIAVKEPLPTPALRMLGSQGENDTVDVVGLITRPLGSLLSGVGQNDTPVRALHTSFRDFLTDPGRSGRFYVDTSLQDQKLALASLQVMTSELRFNICDLKSSHAYNDEISDLSKRVALAIPIHLSYSCRFWTDHLHATRFDADILGDIKMFMRNRFLYWLEVLSLAKEVKLARHALTTISEWCESHDGSTVAFAKDAIKFVATFGDAISQSTPHIYVSALAFAPTESIVSKTFLSSYPQIISVDVGKAIHWPNTQYVLEGHTRSVQSVALSSDSKLIASGSEDITIIVWDAETGRLISQPLQGHSGCVNSVAFSPDNKLIASASDDKTIRIWDVVNGDVVSGPFEGHTDAVTTIVFSRDGRHIISGSNDKTVRVWDAQTGDIVSGPFEGHTDTVTSIAVSWDDKLIASGSKDTTIRVWDAETGHIISGPLEEHSGPVSSIAFSPNNKHLVSGSYDYTILVWDVVLGSIVLGPFPGPFRNTIRIVLSYDGRRIVSCSDDETIEVWDAETGNIISGPFSGHTDTISSLALSQDGNIVVSGAWDQTVRVWDITESADVATVDFDSVLDVNFDSQDNCTFPEVTTDSVKKTVEGHLESVTCVAFSPGGKYIVSSSADGTIGVWEAKTGTAVLEPFGLTHSYIQSISISPDGKYIASGCIDNTVSVWDAESGEAIFEPLRGHTGVVLSVAFSGDGTRIVSGSLDRTIRIWDAQTGIISAGPFEGHTSYVKAVIFSQDSRRVISSSLDGTVRVWDAETGSIVLGPLEGYPVHSLTCIATSWDGKMIASGSNKSIAWVWDAETGDIILQLGPDNGHTAYITSIAFSPNGKWIVTGSEDKTVLVWDVKTGKVVLGPLDGHISFVTSVAFSPDSKCIVSGSRDKTIRVWDVGIETSLSRSFDRSTRDNRNGDALPDSNDDEIPGGFDNTLRFDHGWVVNGDNELLFWVPPWNRMGKWWPRNTLIIAQGVVTELNFDRFLHGVSWERCREPMGFSNVVYIFHSIYDVGAFVFRSVVNQRF